MYDFECHYREERWQTARYFDFVKEFLIAAQISDDSDDCDPPPCPTTPHTVTTEETLRGESFRVGLTYGSYPRICILVWHKFEPTPNLNPNLSLSNKHMSG